MKRAALLAGQRLMNGLEPVAQGIVIALAVHFQQYAANELGIHLSRREIWWPVMLPSLISSFLRCSSVRGALVVTQASVTP